MTTGQTPSVDRDCVIYEAQEWLLNGLCGEIIFSTVVSKVKNNFWEFINLGQKHLVCFYIIYQYHHNVIKFQGGTVLTLQHSIYDRWQMRKTLHITLLGNQQFTFRRLLFLDVSQIWDNPWSFYLRTRNSLLFYSALNIKTNSWQCWNTCNRAHQGTTEEGNLSKITNRLLRDHCIKVHWIHFEILNSWKLSLPTK